MQGFQPVARLQGLASNESMTVQSVTQSRLQGLASNESVTVQSVTQSPAYPPTAGSDAVSYVVRHPQNAGSKPASIMSVSNVFNHSEENLLAREGRSSMRILTSCPSSDQASWMPTRIRSAPLLYSNESEKALGCSPSCVGCVDCSNKMSELISQCKDEQQKATEQLKTHFESRLRDLEVRMFANVEAITYTSSVVKDLTDRVVEMNEYLVESYKEDMSQRLSTIQIEEMLQQAKHDIATMAKLLEVMLRSQREQQVSMLPVPPEHGTLANDFRSLSTLSQGCLAGGEREPTSRCLMDMKVRLQELQEGFSRFFSQSSIQSSLSFSEQDEQFEPHQNFVGATAGSHTHMAYSENQVGDSDTVEMECSASSFHESHPHACKQPAMMPQFETIPEEPHGQADVDAC